MLYRRDDATLAVKFVKAAAKLGILVSVEPQYER
jgi:hypothetical protein